MAAIPPGPSTPAPVETTSHDSILTLPDLGIDDANSLNITTVTPSMDMPFTGPPLTVSAIGSIPTTQQEAINDGVRTELVDDSPNKGKLRQRVQSGASIQNIASSSSGTNPILSSVWKNDAQRAVANRLANMDDRIEGVIAESRTHTQELMLQIASIAAKIDHLSEPSHHDFDALRNANNQTVQHVGRLTRDISDIQSTLQAILSTIERLENGIADPARDNKRVRTVSTISNVSAAAPPADSALHGAYVTTQHAPIPANAQHLFPSAAGGIAPPSAPSNPSNVPFPSLNEHNMFVNAPIPAATVGGIPEAPAPAVFSRPNERYSVRIGPMSWTGDVTGSVVSLIRMTRRGTRISQAVRARRDGPNFVVASWKSEREAKDFYDAWHEQPPAGYEYISVSLNF